MASAAKDLRYRREYSVDGSLARDLDWEIRERQLRHAGETPRRIREEAQPQRRTAEKTQVHVELRQRQEVSYAAIAGVALVLGLAVMVLMSYIQLTALSAETVALKKQLKTLEAENVTLTAQYERMFDQNAVKEAAQAAGMSKPGSSQIYYIDLSDGDNAVVYQHTEPNVLSRVLTSVNHGVYTAVEYFR